jgi:iron complex outermembrane receptor protein
LFLVPVSLTSSDDIQEESENKGEKFVKQLSKIALGVLVALGVSSKALAESTGGTIEEIVVTAQRTSESIQDVPIAVSAFNSEALESRQIDTFSDLQFNVPNVAYSKANFSGNNFQIRGIGTLLTATSGDSGVGMHVNDVYLNSPRIFETEYYDMAQVEVLRGPQGTLFGRNATGGVVNLKTARPVIGETLYDIDLGLGNYDHNRIKGSVNVPIGDTMALRVAGVWLDRDGYTDNLLGGDVDGRDQWSARASFRWEIGDDTRLDIIGHRFEEDSNRSRSQKQLCNQDPSAILGCIPDSLPTEPINTFATSGTLLASNLILGPLGIFDFFGPRADPSFGNPSDLREVRLRFEPQYEADEDFLMFELNHAFSNGFELNLIGAHQETTVVSRQDYNGTAAAEDSAVLPAAFCAIAPAACTYFGTTAGGGVPVSLVPDLNNSLGAIAGTLDEFTLTTRGSAVDLSDVKSAQDSVEIRLSSNYDGDWNFMLAGFYMEFESSTNYFVQAAGLDYASIGLAPQSGSPDSFISLAPGYFNNETEAYNLESTGIFGEVYWQASDQVQITLGLRYNKDEKAILDRQVFLNVPVLIDVPTRTTSFLGSNGSVVPVTTIDQLIRAAVDAGDYDANPNVAGSQIYREFEQEFEEYTGRLVVDWTPDVNFTDETLVYFSYSKGYKGGGINPAIDTNLFPGTPTTFDPEDIDAFEIGTKNTLRDGTLQINANIFAYDYGGLQIGKIINRTSVNENTDADIFGAEAEFLWAPTVNWQLNAAVSYLNTELGDTTTIDPRDPTQGRQDVTLYKDFANASNCVLEHNGGVPPSQNAAFVAAVSSVAPYLQTGADGGLGIPATPGISDSAFSACAAIAGFGPAFGYNYLDSVGLNLEGNELLQSPEMTVSLGAEYTWFLGSGAAVSARLDYYWQDEFYTTTFNRPQDLVGAWDIYNAQVVLLSASEEWSVTAFIQNIEDDDEITGTYQTDPSSGLFTNAFFIEPRLYGMTFKWRN